MSKTVSTYTHPAPDSTQEPVVDPSRVFYVSAILDGRSSFVLGPFETHAEALERVAEGRSLACEHDSSQRASWAAYGTCSVPRGTTVVTFQDRLEKN